jgi:hypothetical protein
MTRWTRLLAAVPFLLVLRAPHLVAQGPPPGPDMTIDAATVTTVVDGVVKNLTDYYVFPDVAGKVHARWPSGTPTSRAPRCSTPRGSQPGSVPPGCQSWIGLPSGSDSLAKRPFG